jgi:tetratricopeptide (TPR) repeat protein
VSGEADAVRLLTGEAWAAISEGRYDGAMAAGERAVRAAEGLDDTALLVEALAAEAEPLRMRGDKAAALARYTRVLALADDPANAERLRGEQAAWVVARAYVLWVDCAQYLTGVSWRKLFGVLDAAEKWLTATGRRQWRAGVLLQRALIHRRLGEWDAAVAAGQEALIVYQSGAPGASLAAHRCKLGDILRGAGRHGDAQPLYQAILDDPDSTTYARCTAYHGLAWCALADEDPATARQHAVAAVRLAEPFGEDVLCEPLQALVAACRAGGDLDAARHAATRQMDAAGRIGERYRLYPAVRDAVDVALDRGDVDTARGLLADLDDHAAALDAAAGTTTRTDEAAERNRRFAKLAEETL